MELIGHQYLVISELGSGAYGTTFLVEDTRSPSRRRCVLKQLKPISNPEHYGFIIKRFEREATVLERLGEGGNGQIPKLFAYFAEGGLCYIVQELIEGRTLTAHLKERIRYTEAEVVEFLKSILPVLDFIHSQQIIHRDIKPDNIIIRENGKPVLIDFGIVKEVMNLDSVGNPTSSIVAGTPAFMPLEQAAGKPVFASDLYSVAMTAICMLTGKSPLQMTDRLTGDLNWRAHTQVSDKVAEVLERATRANFKERYLTAREMLDSLIAAISPAKQTSRQLESTDVNLHKALPPPKPPPIAVDLSPVEVEREAQRQHKAGEQAYERSWTGWGGSVLGVFLVVLGYGYLNNSPWMSLNYWAGNTQSVQIKPLEQSSGVLKEQATKNPPTALEVPYGKLVEKPPEKPSNADIEVVNQNFPGGAIVTRRKEDGEIVTETTTPKDVHKMLERVVKEPVRVTEQYLLSKVLRRAEPIYPLYAALSNTGGKVVVQVVVDVDGSVVSAKAVSGPEILQKPAVDAARKWQFQPKSAGELQVKVVGPITFEFDPKRASVNRTP